MKNTLKGLMMSKLIEAIRAVKTGKLSPLRTVTFNETRSFSLGTATSTEYEFTAKVSVKMSLCDPETYPDALKETLKSVQHRVADEVFGEYRLPLLELRTKAYASGDLDSASIIDGILDSTFKV